MKEPKELNGNVWTPQPFSTWRAKKWKGKLIREIYHQGVIIEGEKK